MMRRISILLFCGFSLVLIFNATINASNLTPPDSLRVKNIEDKQFILHKVEPGETWSHLSRKYNCTVSELQAANTGVEMLKIDQIINVPVNANQVKKTNPAPTEKPSIKTSTTVNTDMIPVKHTVVQGETLFGISRRFDQPVDRIKQFNNLTNDAITPGQKLIVRYISKTGNQVLSQTESQIVIVPPSQPKAETVMASTSADIEATSSNHEIKRNPSQYETVVSDEVITESTAESFFDKPTRTITPLKKGSSGKSMMQVHETGVASWILDGQVSKDKYYGLHRSAPIGTIIKVTNRMNNQFAYVKVVGVLPDTGENSNVIIKMSQAVSQKLNVLDPLFQVEMSYGLLQ